VAASGVEDRGRRIEVEAVEERIAGAELTHAAAQEHERAEENEIGGRPGERDAYVVVAGWDAVTHREGGDEAHDAGDEHAADGAGGIEAVVGASELPGGHVETDRMNPVEGPFAGPTPSGGAEFRAPLHCTEGRIKWSDPRRAVARCLHALR
jgi:hypothetical protein